jgi:hypothetical protein
MDTTSTLMPPLRAIFEGAKHFGLTDEEAWRAVDESLREVWDDATVSQFRDELTAVLARDVLAKRRQNGGTGRAGRRD